MNPSCCVNQYGRSPDLNIMSVTLSFSNSAELSVAKELLFKSVADVAMDGLPRCVPRRVSDDKAKLEVGDIFVLVDYMNKQNHLSKYPLRVANNLEMLPPFKTDVFDLCLAVKRINALEEPKQSRSRISLTPLSSPTDCQCRRVRQARFCS